MVAESPQPPAFLWAGPGEDLERTAGTKAEERRKADLPNISTVNPAKKFFFEQLYYDQGFNNALYDGNISGIIWKNPGAAAKQRYYGYTST